MLSFFLSFFLLSFLVFIFTFFSSVLLSFAFSCLFSMALGMLHLFADLLVCVESLCVFCQLVFFAWRVPRLQPLLVTHFTTSVAQLRSGRVWTMITSGFSHHSGGHFLFNMVGLFTISDALVRVMGERTFLEFYLQCLVGSEVVSCVFSLLLSLRSPMQLTIPSLGASGALFGLFALSQLLFPDTKFVFFFFPFKPIEASTLLPALVAFDLCGLVYSLFAHSPLGHGAHLGGVLFGICYFHYVLREENRAVQRIISYNKRQGVRSLLLFFRSLVYCCYSVTLIFSFEITLLFIFRNYYAFAGAPLAQSLLTFKLISRCVVPRFALVFIDLFANINSYLCFNL